MVDQQALDYIRQQRGYGVADGDIRKKAVVGGFTEQEIDEAFAALGGSAVLSPAAEIVPDTSAGPAITVKADTPPQPVPQAPVNQTASVKLGKFKASRLIVKESWGVLKQDKELMWFPVISAIVAMFAVVIMGIAYFEFILGGNFSNLSSDTGPGPLVSYGILLVYYLVMFYIANFFQAAMLVIIAARFRGQNLGFGDGIRGAVKNSGKLFIWSLISATVGVVLKLIADRGKIFSIIVAALLGAAWNILTYFSLPALIVGGVSVKESFKESAAAIRKTWGETIIVNFGVSLFISIIILLVSVIAITMMVVVQSAVPILIMLGLWILFVVAALIVSATLGSIFKLALYEYAKNGTIPAGFSPELIRGAIRKK